MSTSTSQPTKIQSAILIDGTEKLYTTNRNEWANILEAIKIQNKQPNLNTISFYAWDSIMKYL